MTENCLLLHVLTPNVTGNLPVLIWIHGGGYVAGFASAFPLDGVAKNLARKGVVVVLVNYRLNVFGFFTSRTTEFPGNMGMQDQIQALRWVQAEIRHFGGDPDRVTICGLSAGRAQTKNPTWMFNAILSLSLETNPEPKPNQSQSPTLTLSLSLSLCTGRILLWASVGGSSVSLLTYSPLARGLFKQAMMQSGTAYVTWAWNGVKGYYDESSKRLAIALNCSTADEWDSGKNFQTIVKCLREKPRYHLVNILPKEPSRSLGGGRFRNSFSDKTDMLSKGPRHGSDLIRVKSAL